MQTAADLDPIACTLLPDALEQRLAWIRRVTMNGLVAHRRQGTQLALTYRPEAKPELVQIVAEEQRCCAFLQLSLRDVQDGVELSIQVPEGSKADALRLLEHFLPVEQSAITRKPCNCAPGRCG